MQEFVILFHELPNDVSRSSHWDLMLREDDHLLTWALDANPLKTERLAAQRLPNHRLVYLDYEGEISGGRGRVERIAKGQFEWTERTDLDNWIARFDLGRRSLQFKMCGSRELAIVCQ